ncbi:high-potential iron-sulfur protein [Eisenibacter elegans]|jgi:hypothetical protein|uniref:high-potential iron-sulfur protein n=1 Tax=Eisenibacter elegans TaxID=997 RepID=UPI0012B5EC6A|nr:high-potential iron-sulfur protein [Eisenibacter elegans]
MISRKEFLIKSLGLMGAAIAVPSLLSSCAEAKKELAADACDDLSGLSETEIKKRESLKYVSQTPDAAKNCANCRFYKAPAQEGECGGCQLFAGIVHPNGYCQSWFAVEA